jgi:hypothetical protein
LTAATVSVGGAVAWPPPDPGDIVWCRFPEDVIDSPGQKPRPALVLAIEQYDDGWSLLVSYGTSQKLNRLLTGEFAIRKLENSSAYTLAGLSVDTKFDLGRTLELPWNGRYFSVPPNPRFGQTPKLGSLHVAMTRTVEAALRAAKPRRS